MGHAAQGNTGGAGRSASGAFPDVCPAGFSRDRRLEESFRAGAKGLKFHKSLGLSYRYKNGKLMPIDDPKLDLVWEMCAKYNRPVMIHTADPAAFFTPLDRFNERWHELNAHPNWLFHGDRFPSREELLAQDARISELGRQPYTARKFFLKYQDRVMFGTDTTPRREAYYTYYRFLETDDEYFDCASGHHRQGFWMIYGVFLPKDVLEKLYHKSRLGAAAPAQLRRPSLRNAFQDALLRDRSLRAHGGRGSHDHRDDERGLSGFVE